MIKEIILGFEQKLFLINEDSLLMDYLSAILEKANKKIQAFYNQNQRNQN